jgi:phage terminase large subunit-like protein
MASLGEPLDEWQENVLQAALGERSDGRWAARQVGVSAPRQNGKSQLIVARVLAGILFFGEELILCSAHQQDTSREVFSRLVDILERNPKLNARVESYGKALNREYIRFKTGQTVRFKARSTGGGRGFSADCVLLDEAQILSGAAWSAILPTLSARPNPQVWLLGTPPTPLDDGEVFGRFRAAGLEGKDTRLAWAEWGANPQDDIDDPATWAAANPFYPVRISHEAIEGERSTMSDEQFMLERLGMWTASEGRQVIDATSWALAADPASMAIERLALAVDVSYDRSVASVSLAGERPDGLWHVELDEQRAGTGWVVPWIVGRCERNQIRAVVVDAGSPAASMIDELAKHKIKVTTTSTRDVVAACGQFYDLVMGVGLRHTDQPQVNVALSEARKKPVGDGWIWNRKSPHSNITSVISGTLALWGAQTTTVTKPTPKRRSSGRRAVVL